MLLDIPNIVFFFIHSIQHACFSTWWKLRCHITLLSEDNIFRAKREMDIKTYFDLHGIGTLLSICPRPKSTDGLPKHIFPRRLPRTTTDKYKKSYNTGGMLLKNNLGSQNIPALKKKKKRNLTVRRQVYKGFLMRDVKKTKKGHEWNSFVAINPDTMGV